MWGRGAVVWHGQCQHALNYPAVASFVLKAALDKRHKMLVERSSHNTAATHAVLRKESRQPQATQLGRATSKYWC